MHRRSGPRRRLIVPWMDAWGDPSPIGLGRAMPNACWLGWESRLSKGEAAPQLRIEPSSEKGPMRRDPQGALCARRACSAHDGELGASAPATHRRGLLWGPGRAPQGASATGSFAVTSRRSRRPTGMRMPPGTEAVSVAPFRVSAGPRLVHVNRALVASEGHTYEVQETDGVDPSAHRVTPFTAGDRCPGAVTLASAAPAAHEVMG